MSRTIILFCPFCSCKACPREYNINMSKWDKQNEINKRWRRCNKAQVATIMRRGHYRRKYNQQIGDYNKMLALQNGVCAICERSDNFHRKFFDMDHSHITGKARGLLCLACNRIVGKVEHETIVRKDIFEKVQDYLAFHVDILIDF